MGLEIAGRMSEIVWEQKRASSLENEARGRTSKMLDGGVMVR